MPRAPRITLLVVPLAAAGLCAAFAPRAAAQATAPPAKPKPAIEEIVVTAERRESTEQKTPISMSVFDAGQIDRLGIQDLEDLQIHTPNMIYSSGGGGSTITQIALRGVGNENVTPGGDPGVAYNVDGVYIGRPSAAGLNEFDIERIEVLRGPQGTLYGRNATGGLINVITKQPTPELDMNADMLWGNFDTWRVRAAVGGPIVGENVMARIAVVRGGHDGYQKQTAFDGECQPDCDDADSSDLFGIRGQVLLKFGERVDLLLSGQSYSENGDQAYNQFSGFPNAVFGIPGFPYGTARPHQGDLRKLSHDQPHKTDLWSNGATGKLTVDLGDMPLLGGVVFQWISSRSRMEWDQILDLDYSELPIAVLFWNEPSDQWVHEFQFRSSDAPVLDWVMGGFYLNEDVQQTFGFDDQNVFIFRNGGNIETKSYAAFGQGTLKFQELIGAPLRLTGGLRWTRDRKKGRDFVALSFTPPTVPPFPGWTDVHGHWDATTGKLGVEYDLYDDTMIYASWGKGYKSGGFLVGNREPDGTPNRYEPETIYNYESGVKTRFLDGRVSINATYFNADYEDLQQFFLEVTGARIENAPEASIQGIELETVVVPIDGLRLNAGYAWLDAEFDEFSSPDNASADPTTPVDLAGEQLNRAPDYQLNVGAEYEIPLGDLGSLTPRIDWFRQDVVCFRPFNLPSDCFGPWDRTDLSLTWRSAESQNGQWLAEVYVKNVQDNDEVQNMFLGSGTLGFPQQVTLFPPRLYGIRVGLDF